MNEMTSPTYTHELRDPDLRPTKEHAEDHKNMEVEMAPTAS